MLKELPINDAKRTYEQGQQEDGNRRSSVARHADARAG